MLIMESKIKEKYEKLLKPFNSNNDGIKIRIEFDPLLKMINECCEVFPETYLHRPITPTNDLFELHKAWFTLHGFNPMSETTFGSKLIKLFPCLKKRRLTYNKKLRWVHEGITMRPSNFSMDNVPK